MKVLTESGNYLYGLNTKKVTRQPICRYDNVGSGEAGAIIGASCFMARFTEKYTGHI